MSPRALTALAVLAAGLAGPTGRAAAQMPPEAVPLSGFPAGLAVVGGQPPEVLPAMPPPGMVVEGDPGMMAGPVLPTDALGGSGSRGPKAWVGTEYLLYWTKNAPLPVPIATVGPTAGTGVLGTPGVRVAVGNADLDFKERNGVRVVAGYWFTNDETFGMEANFFILPDKTSGTAAIVGSDILPTLARPFTDSTTGLQSSRVLTRPGAFAGGIRSDATQELWGGEIGGVFRFRDYGRVTLDALAAFKYLNLNESIAITDFASAQRGGFSLFQGRGVASPSTTYVTDQFRTNNDFFGGTVGGRANLHIEAFTFSLTGKIGFGDMHQTVRADGTTTLTTANAPAVTSGGGFYAVSANSGKFTRSQFVVIPELATNLNVQITSRFAVNFGYNYLAISDVVRPGDQLSTRINPTQLPTSPNFGARFGPATTVVPLNTSSFWAQGINVGLIFGF